MGAWLAAGCAKGTPERGTHCRCTADPLPGQVIARSDFCHSVTAHVWPDTSGWIGQLAWMAGRSTRARHAPAARSPVLVHVTTAQIDVRLRSRSQQVCQGLRWRAVARSKASPNLSSQVVKSLSDIISRSVQQFSSTVSPIRHPLCFTDASAAGLIPAHPEPNASRHRSAIA